MPVKNTSSFLQECLSSIIKQTYTNWQLIAIDDNSTDNSYDILSDYSLKDNRVCVFKNQSSGIISALQLGYSKSNGQFITRMDSDDIMDPHKLELLHNNLSKKGNGHIAVGLVNYFSTTELGEGYRKYAEWLNKLTISETNFNDIYKECCIPSPCWMVSKSDFEKCGAFNTEIYPEDYDLAFRFKKTGLKITAVKSVIHNWRDYDARTSRTNSNYADNSFFDLKIRHFLDQDYNSNFPLILWGAGSKGKQLAKLLIQNNIQFSWACNNSNKIGKNIYNVKMENLDLISQIPTAQVIVAISSVSESDEVNKLISQNPQHPFFRFC